MALTEVIQCPRCRTVNYPGLMGYPRCHRCHEPLRQCLHCKHQTGGLCQLAADARPPLLVADQLPYCAAFGSRYARGASITWWQRPLVGGQRVYLLAGVLLLVAVAAGLIIRQHTDVPTRLAADSETVNATDGGATIGLTVTGDPRRHDEVTIEVRSAAAFWLAVEPVPLNTVSTAAPRLRYRLPRSGRLRVLLQVRPRRQGTAANVLPLRLLGPDGEELDAVTIRIDRGS